MNIGTIQIESKQRTRSLRLKDEHRRLLFPTHLPRRITRAQASEGLIGRLRRFKIQTMFSARRLRFHLTEGLRLAVESPGWERRLAGVSE